MIARPLVLFIVVILSACSQKTDIGKKLDNIVTRYHQNGVYNGTILIADSTGILLKKSYGLADFATGEPLNISSTFYLASVSKQFTAMAVLLLKEQGRLSLDDTLGQLLPDLPSWATSVTVRHLLTHTSGIADYYNLGAARPGFTNADVVNVVRGMDSLNFAPGSKFEYSNTGYVLLSSIVQQVSGQGFNEFMQQNVFEPAGMAITVAYDESRPDRKNRCKGFDADGKEDDYPYFTTGGGGIYSNAEDLYNWHLALQNGLLILPEAMKEAYTPVQLSNGSVSWYGFGWMLDEENPAVVLHTGTLTSFRTYIERDLATGRVIIMLNNVGKTQREELLEELRTAMTQPR